MLDAERGWPKTEPCVNVYVAREDEDGESDSDTLTVRHRESDECEIIDSIGGANFDSEDEVDSDEIKCVTKRIAVSRTKRSCN